MHRQETDTAAVRFPSRSRRPPKYLDDYESGNISNSDDEIFVDTTCYVDFCYKVPVTYTIRSL